jgi:hypothetical protein
MFVFHRWRILAQKEEKGKRTTISVDVKKDEMGGDTIQKISEPSKPKR